MRIERFVVTESLTIIAYMVVRGTVDDPSRLGIDIIDNGGARLGVNVENETEPS